VSKNKRAKWAHEPSPQKTVHFQQPGGSTGSLTVHWSFRNFDRQFRVNRKDGAEDGFCDVASHMKAFEGKTWAEIERDRKHDHPVPCAHLVREAQNRLQEIKLDDLDELWRFRFSGERRIWGIRDGRLFRVLWWDPEHQICPSPLKHT